MECHDHEPVENMLELLECLDPHRAYSMWHLINPTLRARGVRITRPVCRRRVVGHEVLGSP